MTSTRTAASRDAWRTCSQRRSSESLHVIPRVYAGVALLILEFTRGGPQRDGRQRSAKRTDTSPEANP